MKTILLSLYVEMTEHSFVLGNAYYRQRGFDRFMNW